MNKKIVLFLILIVCVVISIIILRLSKQNPYVGVEVDHIRRADVAVRIQASGKVEMQKTRVITSERTSEITELYVELGQLVEEDAKLLKLKNYGDVKAPFKGTVIALPVDLEDKVTVGTPLLTLGDLTTLFISMDIHEYDAPFLKKDQSVTIYSNAYPNDEYTGQIMEIAPIASSVQSSTGVDTVVKVKSSLTSGVDKLIPGNNVDCQIIVDEKKNVVVVPVASVVKDADGKDYVYIVDENNLLVKRFVELGYYSSFSVEVKSGVNEDDLIVLSPKDEYEEGMTVAPLLPADTIENDETEQNSDTKTDEDQNTDTQDGTDTDTNMDEDNKENETTDENSTKDKDENNQ